MTQSAKTSKYKVTLSARFDALVKRTHDAAAAAQAAAPLTGRPVKAQKAFLLANSDVQTLQHLCQPVETTMNGLNLTNLTAEQLKDAGSLFAAMSAMVQEAIESSAEQYGIAKRIFLPICIQDLKRQLDHIETVVDRLEASVAVINGA